MNNNIIKLLSSLLGENPIEQVAEKYNTHKQCCNECSCKQTNVNVQAQSYTDYPESFFTNNLKIKTQSTNNASIQQVQNGSNILNSMHLGANGTLLKNCLPMLFGKNNFNLTNILENGNFSEILNIFNKKNKQTKSADNKIDATCNKSVIDLSEYEEIS